MLKQAQFHGASRLADPVHRHFWMLTLLLFFGCSVAVVWATVTRYISTPTYMVQITSVEEWLPFPTVVLCPEISYSEQKIENFLAKIKYPPEMNATHIRSILPQLAAFYSRDVSYELANLEILQNLLEYNNLDVETAGTMLTASCAETLIKCFWRSQRTNCSTLFEMEMTGYGFCCVFNGRSLKREMKNPGFKPKRVQRLHIGQVGRYNGLTIAIDQNVSRSSAQPDLNFKLLSIKNNGNFFVDTIRNGTPVPVGVEVWSGYSTKGVYIGDEVRHLSQDLLRCRLANEPMKYFPEYHRLYCLMECEMAQVLALCNCTQVQHPALPGVPQCRARDLNCTRSLDAPHGLDNCACPMTCDRDIQIISPFRFFLDPNVVSYDLFYDGLDLNKVTIVRLYLQNYNKMIYSRESYFTNFNLFAQLGGVFNVFFGCSVLTLLELLMLVWNTCRRNNNLLYIKK